jgi:hypothetical protein
MSIYARRLGLASFFRNAPRQAGLAPLRHGTVVIRHSATLQNACSGEEAIMTLRLISTLFVAVTVIGGQPGYIGTSWAQVGEKRYFTIAAVEPRGGVNVGQEPFPTEALPPGEGYVIRQPDQSGRWEISVYLWSPSQIVVHQGDEVTLDFVGINGAFHPTEIKGLGKEFAVQRGHVVRVEFKAERAGVYPVICHTHVPTMRGEIVVLPRN